MQYLSKHGLCQSDDKYESYNYLRDFRCNGDSEEVHGYIHTSHHGDEQGVARVAMGTQASLVGKKKLKKRL